MINIYNFGDFIDTRIISRGFNYYQNNHIISVEETEKNNFEAQIRGSSVYITSIELTEDLEISFCFCDCPYDYGVYCKHIVALLYYLSDYYDSFETNTKLFTANSDLSIVKDILAKIDKSEIVDFLINIADENEIVANKILLAFSDKSLSINYASRIIHNSINDAYVYTRNGSYLDIEAAIRGAESVLDRANELFVSDKLQAAKLAMVVIREMIDLYEENEYNYEASYCIEKAALIIEKSVSGIESKIEKDAILRDVIDLVSLVHHVLPEMSLDMLKYCVQIAEDSNRHLIESKLYLIENAFNMLDVSQYYEMQYLEQINLAKFELVKKFNSDVIIKEYIIANMKYPAFKEIAFNEAMKAKNYKEAIKLCTKWEQEDALSDRKINRWKNLRYRACKEANDLTQLKTLAQEFALRGEPSYFKELKEILNKEEWTYELSKLLNLMKNKKMHLSSTYREIIVYENLTEEIVNFARRKPDSITQLFTYLIDDYQEEVKQIYLDYIRREAKSATYRKQYRGVCKIILDFAKLSFYKRANCIVDELKKTYYRKPAFIDELSKVDRQLK